MDSKSFLYIPKWVKFVAIAALCVTLWVSGYFVWSFMDIEGRDSWILVGMSTAQTAGSALILFLVVAFSQRDATVKGVRAQSDFFLTTLLPDALRRVKVDAPDFAPEPSWPGRALRRLRRLFREDRMVPETKVRVAHEPGGLAATYLVEGKHKTVRMFAELNVWKAVFVYYIPAETKEVAEKLKKDLAFSFPEDGDDGFTVFSNYSENTFGEGNYLDFVMIKKMPDDFPENNLQRVFLANLIMTHTAGLLRNAHREGIRLSYDEDGARGG